MSRRPSAYWSTATTFGTNGAVAFLSLINVLIVARSLGPGGRGAVVFLMTLAAVTSRLCALGVQEANVNFAGADPRLRPSLATNSLVLALMLGALGSGVVLLLIAIFPGVGAGSHDDLLALALATVPLLLVQFYLWRLIQAEYRFVASNAVLLIAPVVNVVVNGALAAAGALTVGRAFAAWSGGQVLTAVVLVVYVVVRAGGFGPPDRRLGRRTFMFGAKSHIGRVMQLGNFRLDQWLLGAISGSRQLGLYSVAVAWAEALYYLPTAIALVQRPDLVRTDDRNAVQRSTAAFRIALVATIPLAVAAFVLADVLCVDVFGSEFADSATQLRILIPGTLGILGMRIFGNVLVARGRPLLESLAIGTALVATIVLDLALIPPFGGRGAAVASTIAYSVGGVLALTIVFRALGAKLQDLRPHRGDLSLAARAPDNLDPPGEGA